MSENLFGINKVGRPKIKRKIEKVSEVKSFGPLDVDLDFCEKINLTKEEFEAIRLKSILKLDIIEAGQKMGVSKSTFAKIYKNAIQKISEALIYGKIIKLD